jgi:hypothetical protein
MGFTRVYPPEYSGIISNFPSMEETDIKPDLTDSDEESSDLSDLFDEGETNENVTSDAITLKEFEELSGRKFNSIDDAKKHYQNLKSFVGKANQSKEETVEKKETSKDSSIDSVLAEMKELKAQVAERDFILDTPQAKGSLNLVRKVAKADGISLSEAWEQVKDMATSAEEYKKGRDVGVNSNKRINPVVSEKNKEVVEAARRGNIEARDTLVEQHLKAIGLK